MDIGLTNNRLNSYNVPNASSKGKSMSQGSDSFADYFQKGNVKHLEGANYAMAPSCKRQAKTSSFRHFISSSFRQ